MEATSVQFVLKRNHSDQFALCDSKEEFHSLPPRVASRLAGKEVSAPPDPLCDLGLRPEEARKVHEPYGAEAWWDEPFPTGRAPFDSKYCAVWRALFESFAPVERPPSSVFRLLIRSRSSRLRGETVPDAQVTNKVSLDAVSQTIDLGVSPAER